MIWLLLSIITNTVLTLILKSFPKFGIITLQGIVVNYFVAGSIGLLLSGSPLSIAEIPHQAWSFVPLVMGFLFISIFLLLAKTAQTIGISVATVANKMSLAIPVILAILLYGESVTFWKIAGLLLAVVAVYLTALPKQKENKTRNLWMPSLIFIGSGILDALLNHAKRNLVPDDHVALFLSLSFLMAGMIGMAIILIRRIRHAEKFQGKSILAGIILGIPNYFSIYGITRALGSKAMESSAVFPVNNMGIVALSAIAAMLIFKEKFSMINWLGILFALGSIAMIAFT